MSHYKRYLFFLVHPSKYHLFKYTIRFLLNHGHHVDLLIITKDVLEELIKSEKWNYVNLFPNGRRAPSRHPLLIIFFTALNFIRTLLRLNRYLSKNHRYDLFITDDALSVIGRWYKTPSFIFIDDDYSIVRLNHLLYVAATRIISPVYTNMGRFEKKTIHYKGFHELAYLHPEYFTLDPEVKTKYNLPQGRFFLIRLVSLTAHHDVNKKGIDNAKLFKLIDLLKKYGSVYISSERLLPSELNQYRLQINPADILHVLGYADLFIGDSQTMISEAAILGTPSIRFNDFVGRINVMNVKEEVYKLSFGFNTNQFDLLIQKAEELICTPGIKELWNERRMNLINDCIDVVDFYNRLLLDFPNYLKNQT